MSGEGDVNGTVPTPNDVAVKEEKVQETEGIKEETTSVSPPPPQPDASSSPQTETPTLTTVATGDDDDADKDASAVTDMDVDTGVEETKTEVPAPNANDDSTPPTNNNNPSEVTAEPTTKSEELETKPISSPTGSATKTPSALPLSTTTTVTTTISTTIKTAITPTPTPAPAPAPAPAPTTAAAAAAPKITILHAGTLYISPSKRQHIITGSWSQTPPPPSSSGVPSGQFTWKYTVPGDLNYMTLPQQKKSKWTGLFRVNSDGKKRKGVEVVETVEKIIFIPTKKEEGEGEEDFKIEGKGMNKYGAFKLDGTASYLPKTSPTDLPELSVKISKTYYIRPPSELPDVSDSHDVQVCCLRGEMTKIIGTDGFANIKIVGSWSSDRLNLLVPQSELKVDQIVSPFELVHKSGTKMERMDFPPVKQVRLAGWFEFWNLTTQSTTKVGENDISFKLLKNNGGGWNVEGRGRNQYGTFFLTGTLEPDGKTIELYKHFPPRPVASKKPDKPRTAVEAAPPVSALPLPPPVVIDPPTLAEIELSDDLPLYTEPRDEDTGFPLYECYMRGNVTSLPNSKLRIEGEWCAQKEHFDAEGSTKNRSKFWMERPQIEPHLKMTDSYENWTGGFSMRQKSGSSKKVSESKISIKFAPNDSQTGQNCSGVGVNDFGRFKFIGSFFELSDKAGKIEIYKWYTQMKGAKVKTKAERKKSTSPKPKPKPSAPPINSISAHPSLKRQPSGRAIKVPNKDFAHSSTKLSLEMSAMLKIIDALIRADYYKTFSVPIDPIALGIPDYFQVVTDPMDFGTLKKKIASGEVTTHSQCAHNVRLVFSNCFKYNKPNEKTQPILDMARELRKRFETDYSKYRDMVDRKERERNEEEERERKEQAKAQVKATLPIRSRSSGMGQGGVKRVRDRSGEAERAREKRARMANMGGGGGGGGNMQSKDVMAMQQQMSQMAEMIRLQKEQLELVQRQAQANEAKLELSSMGMGMGGGMMAAAPVASYNPAPSYVDSNPLDDVEELTQQQQERLTRTINNLTGARLKSALRVIMNDCGLDDDEEAHQLQLDELPKRTQQKLFDMLIRNKGAGGKVKAGGASIGRPKMNNNPNPNNGYGMNMSMGGFGAAPPVMGVSAQEADEAQVLEFNEFDSSTLENDIVLTGSGDLDLGAGVDEPTPTSNTTAVASDDWAQARSLASQNNDLKSSDARRLESLKAEMATNSASLQQQSAAASLAQQSAESAASERSRLEILERQKREAAESQAAREAMRREREQVEIEANAIGNDDGVLRQESGGFSPISLGAGSASPSGSDYGF
ncbi:hypothetical protein TrST_g10859 [Triparma strigata]|uniref:Bromo domain-containing protein n=1 Tax=Triparma strigata TaxID=1606541 RepID=A0A9W6ZB82_9STRA|nr:hypothetical protein TrST_g10859 [Triparma strigata]